MKDIKSIRKGYIYKVTNMLNGHYYIGQKRQPTFNKLYYGSGVAITHALRKYGKLNFHLEVLEFVEIEKINDREIYYIDKYNARINGNYNITMGGEGVDSETARTNALRYFKNQTDEQRSKRNANCSKGQLRRYFNASDSAETRESKSKSHQGTYFIESPDGKTWIATSGLKEFALTHQTEIKISYWKLFNAYRKCYTGTKNVRQGWKNANNWKVTRIL